MHEADRASVLVVRNEDLLKTQATQKFLEYLIGNGLRRKTENWSLLQCDTKSGVGKIEDVVMSDATAGSWLESHHMLSSILRVIIRADAVWIFTKLGYHDVVELCMKQSTHDQQLPSTLHTLLNHSANTLRQFPEGYCNRELQKDFASLPKKGLPLLTAELLTVGESYTDCNEIIIGDSTLWNPLQEIFPGYCVDNTVFIRLSCPSYPSVFILCGSGRNFIGDLALEAERAVKGFLFQHCRVVPILQSLNPSTQKLYDHLSEHQCRHLGEWMATPALATQLSTPLWETHWLKLYKGSASHVQAEASCWFLSSLLVEAKYYDNPSQRSLKLCMGWNIMNHGSVLEEAEFVAMNEFVLRHHDKTASSVGMLSYKSECVTSHGSLQERIHSAMVRSPPVKSVSMLQSLSRPNQTSACSSSSSNLVVSKEKSMTKSHELFLQLSNAVEMGIPEDVIDETCSSILSNSSVDRYLEFRMEAGLKSLWQSLQLVDQKYEVFVHLEEIIATNIVQSIQKSAKWLAAANKFFGRDDLATFIVFWTRYLRYCCVNWRLAQGTAVWTKFRFMENSKRQLIGKTHAQPCLVELRFALPFEIALPLLKNWSQNNKDIVHKKKGNTNNVIQHGVCMRALGNDQDFQRFLNAHLSKPNVIGSEAEVRMKELLQSRGPLHVDIRVPYQMIQDNQASETRMQLLNGEYDDRTLFVADFFKATLIRCGAAFERESLRMQVSNVVTRVDIDLQNNEEYFIKYKL